MAYQTMVGVNAHDYMQLRIFILYFLHLLEHFLCLRFLVGFGSEMGTHKQVLLFPLLGKPCSCVIIEEKLLPKFLLLLLILRAKHSLSVDDDRPFPLTNLVINTHFPFDAASFLDEYHIHVPLPDEVLNRCLFVGKICIWPTKIRFQEIH